MSRWTKPKPYQLPIENLDQSLQGLNRKFRIGKVEFFATDWVLCEISWSQGNPIHWCLASPFRVNSDNTCDVTIMNPTYEEMRDFVSIGNLHHFKPIRVLLEDKIYPPSLASQGF